MKKNKTDVSKNIEKDTVTVMDEERKEELNALKDWPKAKKFHQPIPLKDINVPNRVIFMEVPSGHVFFDCHPAEARMAMSAVHKARRDGFCAEEKMRADTMIGAAIKCRKKKIIAGSDGILSVTGLNKMFLEVEKRNLTVLGIVINPVSYADIRNWGKTIYDEATTQEILTTGLFGHVWTANIYVRTEIRKGTICLVSINKKGEPFVKRFDLGPRPSKISYNENSVSYMTSFEKKVLDGIKQSQIVGDIKSSVFPCFEVLLENAPFMIDLAFPDVKVAVECDSDFFNSTDEQIIKDKERDEKLSSLGWTVLRFCEEEVKNRINEVVNMIHKAIRKKESDMRHIAFDIDVDKEFELMRQERKAMEEAPPEKTSPTA